MRKNILVELLVGSVVGFQLFFFFLPEEIRYPLFSVLITLSSVLYFKKEVVVPKTILILLCLLLFTVTLSGFFSPYPFRATLEIVKFGGLIFFLNLCFNLAREERFQKIEYFVYGIITFWGLAGIIEYTSRGINSPHSLFEPFYWPTLAAGAFLLSLPIIFYKLLETKQEQSKYYLFFGATYLLLVAWILTFSYLPIILICLIYTLYFFQKNFKKLLPKLLLLSLLITVTLPNFLPSFGNQSLNKEVALFQERLFFEDQRDVLNFSKNTIQSNFWWGIGPGVFGPLYRTRLTKPWTWSDFSSIEPLQTFVENGVFTFIVQLILYTYLILLCIKKSFAKVNPQSPSFKIRSFSLLLFILLSLGNISLRIFPMEIIFFLMLSYILKDEKSIIISRKLYFLIAVPLLTISLLILLDSFSLREIQRNFVKNASPKTVTTLNNLTKRSKYLLNPKTYYWLSAAYLDNHDRKQTLESLKNVLLLEPYNEEIKYQIAKTYYVEDDLARSQNILQKILNDNVFSPPKYYLALANMSLEKGDKDSAKEILKRALDNFPLNHPLYRQGREILDNTEYSLSLRQIAYLLFTLTQDKKYLDYYYQ